MVKIQRSLNRSLAIVFRIRVLINFIFERTRSHVEGDTRIVNAALIIDITHLEMLVVMKLFNDIIQLKFPSVLSFIYLQEN
jgi:hypothetical protein